MADGLRRSSFRVKDINVSGTATGNLAAPMTHSKSWYVDASKATAASGDGTTWDEAVITIAEAIVLAAEGDVIYIAAKAMVAGATDPTSYEENLTIPAGKASLALIGVSRGRTQGGLPQLKDGATTTQHILRIRAPGCLIMNLGFNGAGNTGGGILLDETASNDTAFGTSIIGCHFKNCKGTSATDARTGGAINWAAVGGAWQVYIAGCRFYKCVGDIILMGTSSSRPQDVVIEDCVFSGPAGSVDCNIYIAAGSGFDGIIIRNCEFGQLPAIGSGSVVRYIDATGCVGMLTNCTFGCVTDAAGTELTFKAAGTGAKIPTTMHIVRCYGQTQTDDVTGEINIS